MNPTLALLLGLLLGVLVGVVIGVLVTRSRRSGDVGLRHEVELATLREREASARSQLSAELAATEATAIALENQLRDQREQYRDLVERHRAERDAEAQRQREQSSVLQALSPVQEALRAMQQQVTELETQRSQQYGAIAEQLTQTRASGEQIRTTAESLASALRSNSLRGVWGETQLRNVVQAAGLIERVDFDVQSTITSDSGAGRPDMVIHLPGGKNIAVDAKVPFTAYLEASQIAATATGEEGARRAAFLKEHVKAVRSHIDALGSKAYWAGLEHSPELVIAFIPSESLVASAMEADPAIMDYAFSKKVALASPVTLWSVLKTVAFSWQQDVVTAEAKMLFDLSRELYGRLATLAGHVDKLGRSLENTVKHYNGFVGSLERQVLPSARKLNVLDESTVLGAHAEIEEAPRHLSASELVSELERDEPPARDMHGIDVLALQEQHRDAAGERDSA